MTNRFNRWLMMAFILVLVPLWWLLIANDRGGGPAKPVHIADLRKLAAGIPGERPTAVTGTIVAKRLAMGDYFAAGIGIKQRPLAIVAWALPVPHTAPIVIDPDATAEANLGKFVSIDRGKLSQIDAETRAASLVLHTQGSIFAQRPRAGAARLPHRFGGKAGMVALAGGAAAMASSQPRSLTTAQAVAPGVVIIPAASHAPDARLIYVMLADGREFLFTGNIATLSENWSQLRIRSHLAALRGPQQNGNETYAWLRTIRQLRAEAPQMRIVPGHDYFWLTRQLANGTITDMQPIPPPAPRRRK